MSLLSTVRFIANHPLNRGNKREAVGRFVKWQIGSRLIQGAFIHEWVNGSKFVVRKGETGLTGNIYTGLFEFVDMAFLLHFLRGEDLFVDVGANMGSYTILACAAVGASGYAFEPIPKTYERLVENVRLNHLEARVNCWNRGVGARPGRTAFTSDYGPANRVFDPAEGNPIAVEVDMTSLDIALGDETPSLLKIDVEGYEAPVLEGAKNTLQKETLQAVIMELNGSGSRYGFSESKIQEEMYDYGFRIHSYDPLSRTLVESDVGGLDGDNCLFIRDCVFVGDRLRRAPRFFVNGTQI